MANKSVTTNVSANIKRFAVVAFNKSNARCVVPLTWINLEKSICFWPKAEGPALNALLVKSNCTPNKRTWKNHNIQVLAKFKTLKAAKEAEAKSLVTSDLESDSDEEVLETNQRTRDRHSKNQRPDSKSLQVDSEEESVTFASEPRGGVSLQTHQISTNDGQNVSEAEVNDALGVEINIVNPEKLANNYCSVKCDTWTQTDVEDPGDTFKGSFERFQHLVLKKLAELKIEQEKILMVVNYNSTAEVEFIDLEPCQTQQQLEELEAQLLDANEKSRLEKCLGCIGGSNLQKIVNGILSRLMSDALAVKSSYTGKGKAEFAFNGFKKINDIIVCGTRRNQAFQLATETDIKNAIGEWLRLAGDRNSNRSHKKKDTNVNEK
ncbi:unnamed protein product [Allacma fusca]|uniref:DUF4806 domain-containing protein n=1 Tax=Allacma fusca TaxID=39272 RepID=A0A8J2KXC2_9HEXA|nr:unnamed protein product [Allacma fusca]